MTTPFLPLFCTTYTKLSYLCLPIARDFCPLFLFVATKTHKMKKFGFLIFILLFYCIPASSQKLAIKNNLVWDATLSPNLAVETALGKNTTLDLYAAANLWQFDGGNKKFQHILVQPEFRLWTCERFNGSFFGLHAHWATFITRGLDLPAGMLPALKENAYEGYLWGAGLSYGYQWILGKRWSFEATVGAGYARIHYKEKPCTRCATVREEGNKNYFGPTKFGLSFIYFFR